MILDTAERIKYYTETGLWGEETLLDIFRRHVGNYKGKEKDLQHTRFRSGWRLQKGYLGHQWGKL